MANAAKRGNARTVGETRAQHVIGIGLGAGKITAALVDERARVLARQEADTPQRTTRAVAAAITKLILGASMAEDRRDSLIMAIGVSVPGHVDPESDRVSLPELKNWTRVALGKMIEEGLSDSGYDIRTPLNEKRAKAQPALSANPSIAIQPRICCAAAAEAWMGGARGKDDVVYLSVGDEIEAGIIADGHLLRGAGGTAGLAGWLSLSESFKQEYNAQGCFATEATSGALVRRALDEWSGNSSSTMLGKIIKADPLQLDAAMIIRAARGGDTLANRVVSETCRWMGRGIASLISILNPAAVVIGGSLGLSLKPFFDEVREEAERWSPPNRSKTCRIVGASLGDDAALLGAARLAWLKSAAAIKR